MASTTKTNLRNQVMYSVYVRNHTEEGTFKALEQDLDRIKALGADIIWLMPIHSVGEKAKKGTLGSPYAIRNYREVNPEFGTLEDLKSLVNAIHEKGMKCIIDVVYNHTSPDSWLVENHPEYFYRKPDGNMGNRVGDWSDIVDLDYNNMELWDYQIETLKMWAGTVDGFRCDVAPLIPIEFWMRARKEVAEVNPDCFWLSESIEPEFIRELRSRGMVSHADCEVYQAFDVLYDYDIHRIFRNYVDGKCPLSTYADRVNMQEYIYPVNYVKLRYLENHDQDRAKSFIHTQEALMNWTAFIYFQKGMTLIYGGQETENDRTPSLFDKDTVDWNTGYDISGYLSALYAFKKNPILTDSTYSVKAFDGEDILVGMHVSGEKKLVGVFSFKGQKAEVTVELTDGVYTNILNQAAVEVKDGKIYCDGNPIIVEA
ncbi:MAG: alpha-amylase family glycosyl hydrolase [Lachnospiraceae bacterium]|nr:alpha-amylase family glycosyl hydrolase [Lachnospiraceae bacterium]MEE1248659.1 alpha-amylase family glycosyl hydrolase [Lachnospiraceae bacterium]